VPQYYFHLHNGEGWLHDREGRDLPNLASVDLAARQEARALVAADVAEGLPILLNSYIAVDDESGGEVARISFSEVATFV
jgi:hypothetical protein